jgi:2-(3-amino-3-carboxypropyl)histidine synthase
MKIIYEPVRFEIDSKKIKEFLEKHKSAFIAYTAQYSHLFKGVADSRMVLGCSAKIPQTFEGDKIIFVGDGVFHALMIKKQNIDKTVFVLNPETLSMKEITGQDIKKFIVRELMGIERLKSASKVGIIVSSKLGQERIKEAERLKKKLESLDKKAYLFFSETVNPDEFLNYSGLDLLINTACPRIGLDDYSKFSKPIINIELCKKADYY